MTRLTREDARKLGILGHWPKTPKPPSDGMNRLERAFWERLQDALKADQFEAVWREPIKLRLAGKCWYTPDFMTLSIFNNRFTLWETKGYMRDDASVKLKVAAATYSAFRWVLVRKDRGRWRCIDVTTRGFAAGSYCPDWLA